jgi:hypothetical protein
LGYKRARRSPRTFSWMSMLATVEAQLVLRCLDPLSRLAAARCNRQLYAAASQPFAWPQEQTMTFRVSDDPAALQELGARARRSLLRLLPTVRLRVRMPDDAKPLSSEVFAVPNVHSILLHQAAEDDEVESNFLLPLLRHPAAQQLRILDVSRTSHACYTAELQLLQTLPHLHSLSLACIELEAADSSAPLQLLPLFPILTHFALDMVNFNPEQRLFQHLSRCTRLTSLQLEWVLINLVFLNCMAQLPNLQRLHVPDGRVEYLQPASAWAALRSLRELHLGDVFQTNWLLPALSSVPSLRLLRWRRGPPRQYESSLPKQQRFSSLPHLETLHPLLTAAPMLHVELLLPHTFAEWHASTVGRPVSDALTNVQRRVWKQLHQLPSQLPCVCIVELEADDEPARDNED